MVEEERTLCRVDDLEAGRPTPFPPAPGGLAGLIAHREGGVVRVWVNACPHLGLPLDTRPGRLLDATGRHLVCGAHAARFRVEDGVCVSGPCIGMALRPVPVTVAGGVVRVAAAAGL